MTALIRHPVYLFLTLIAVMSVAASLGVAAVRRAAPLSDEARDNYKIVQGATLTLLALLIGFSLSMAVTRYDQRKNYEEDEANAIGTEYVRADLLDAARSMRIKALLARYLQMRIKSYDSADARAIDMIEGKTADLQDQLWAAVREGAVKEPNAITALVVAGMNDVLNTQGYTQAAWRNRIPIATWVLMIAIALLSAAMQGYGVRGESGRHALLLALPLTVSLSLSLALIADIDSPRGGLIRIAPLNLVSLQRSLGPR